MDQNSLPPIQTTARDDAVLKALVGFVGAEALRPGEKLPTERILAERLKVSRNTVREALTRWEGLGLVERRQFAAVRACFEACRARGLDLDTLSMGMSADLDAAVAEGATIVRVGTALFGHRPRKDTAGG